MVYTGQCVCRCGCPAARDAFPAGGVHSGIGSCQRRTHPALPLATQAQRESAIDHLKRALAACKCSRTLKEEDFLIKDWADLEDADLAALDACGYQHTDCEKLCFDAHDAFSSAYFLELGLPRQQLEARIPGLFTDTACGRVLRVKGFVQDAAGWVELNATADGLTAAPIPAGQEVLIVIGEGLDRERIETVLRS